MSKKPGENTGKDGGIYREVGPRGGARDNYATVRDNERLPPTTEKVTLGFWIKERLIVSVNYIKPVPPGFLDVHCKNPPCGSPDGKMFHLPPPLQHSRRHGDKYRMPYESTHAPAWMIYR